MNPAVREQVDRLLRIALENMIQATRDADPELHDRAVGALRAAAAAVLRSRADELVVGRRGAA